VAAHCSESESAERHSSELVSLAVKDQPVRPNRNAILLTGVTGLVGGLLLRRLAEENAGRTCGPQKRDQEIESDG